MIINKVKTDLLQDLTYYYKGDTTNLEIDFSNSCGEGHVLYLPHEYKVEGASGVIVRNSSGEVIVADGWFDFIIDAETREIYFFWQYLTGPSLKRLSKAVIPDHLWNKLSSFTKELLKSQSYSSHEAGIYEAKLKEKKIFVNDWRLMSQDKYLTNKKLFWRKWSSKNPKWDHDHCEFCGLKFSNVENDEKFGYTTEDNGRWICKDCFGDFKDLFKFLID